MTFPSTSATIARTDAANTFTGHQTIEGVTSTGATGTGKFVFDNTPTLITPNFTITDIVNARHNTTETFANDAFYQVSFNTEDSDTQNLFASNTFTAASDGFYLIEPFIFAADYPANNFLAAIIYINDAAVKRYYANTGSTTSDIAAGGTYWTFLSATNTVKIYVYSSYNNGVTGHASVASVQNRVRIIRLF